MTKSSIVYVHIGENLPDYIYDSVYQTMLINYDSKVYIIVEDKLISNFRKQISEFNLNNYFKTKYNFEISVEFVPLSILTIDEKYTNAMSSVPDSTKIFRDGFWISTTSRFYYIESFMKLFKVDNLFHIENDVLMYENLNSIKDNLSGTEIYMVQDNFDNPPRVIPSILYIPNHQKMCKLTNWITETLVENIPKGVLLNDMELLGRYPDKLSLPYDFKSTENLIFDGACIGQYLGGIDPKNIKDGNLVENIIDNPSKGFINETSNFKPNSTEFFRKQVKLQHIKIPVELFYGQQQTNNLVNLKQIANLHIHSKQLYQYSSVFNMKYKDIITGDRILSICDFIISTPDIYNYHKNILDYVSIEKIVLVNNFQNINYVLLNKLFHDFSIANNTKTIKLFLYTHLLESFTENLVDKLDTSYNYQLYLHNSDHEYNNNHVYNKLLSNKLIKKIYSQNLNHHHPKLHILPIGIANSMFNHGNLPAVYTIMSKMYMKQKTKNLYVNINPNTFSYRSVILDSIKSSCNYNVVSSSKPFAEYLEDLAQHRFCLAIRGNGICTHRFWESLYLGVIPVIINNKHTNMTHFVNHLQTLGLPYFEIKEDDINVITKKYPDVFFNEILYTKIMNNIDKSIYSLDALKISYYS